MAAVQGITQSDIQPEDIHFFETVLPGGGAVSSVHLPQNALVWLENHFEEPLLETIRGRGLGGPIAVMLSPETEALAIFGSILDDWVLDAAKSLSDASNFTVMIQPPEENPILKWMKAQEDGSWNHPVPPKEDQNVPTSGEAELSESDNRAWEGEGTAGSTDSSTDSDPGDLDLGTGVLRLRGGATADDRFTPWLGPVHNLDIHLRIQPSTDTEHQVSILSKIRFTTQSKYLDQHRKGYRPQIISWTELSVVPGTKAILPDRSYSSVGFLVHGQYISKCEPIPIDGFIQPRQITTIVDTDISLQTSTLKLSLGPKPTGEMDFATNHGHNTAVENRNDRITPKWIVDDPQHGRRFQEGDDYYQEMNFAYRSTSDHTRKEHPLRVEFSMGINVGDRKNVKNTELPPVAFIIRNQTMLWVSNPSLKSRGVGIVVLTSACIPEIQILDELFIGVDNQTVQFDGNSTIEVPATDRLAQKVPDHALSLAIGVLPEAVEPGLLKRMSNYMKRPFKLGDHKKQSRNTEIQTLLLYEFTSRGWDAASHEWRMPIYPNLTQCLQQAAENSSLHAWTLRVADLEAENTERLKGKQRDLGPTFADGQPVKGAKAITVEGTDTTLAIINAEAPAPSPVNVATPLATTSNS
ncbi:hypothetical protein C8F04DRAFT_1233194 [Mycena alexandri]|uniref:Uncharacterized protein n=1 Tax=Mycena alexandri TaxID=1745969 RepID=A0AAD6X5F7_9AGAR|nr:hypothetical protein C8F04DRAFT_1233194 [Mycena alexandri]